MVGLLAFALLVRGGALLLTPHALSTDPDGYRHLAENLLEHGSYAYGHVPTAYRPPLYPLMLAIGLSSGRFGTAAIAVLHLALGLATVWLAYRLGQRWGLGRHAILAAVLVACDPILLAQSTLVMTETPAALLAVASLTSLTSVGELPRQRRAILAGACLALATLCRATFLPFLILAALALPMLADTWTRGIKLFGSFLAAAAVILAPWVVRNQIQFGRPVVATTHGGYTLLLGNNPSFYDYLRRGRWGSVWDAGEFNRTWRRRATRTTPADELRNDRLAYAEAWRTIRSDPATFVYSCAVRTGRLWAPMPHQVDPGEGWRKRWGRYLVGLWYLLELVLAGIGLAALLTGGVVRSWWRTGWVWALLLAGSFTAVHSLYWSNLRMRGPLMPAVSLAAAIGAAWIWAKMSGPKSSDKKGLRA